MQPFVLSASRQTTTSQSGQSILQSQKGSWARLAIASLLSLELGFSLLHAPDAVAQSFAQTFPRTTKPVLQGDTIKKHKELPRTVSAAVLQDANRHWGLPLNAGKIMAAKPAQWAYGCDRPTFPYPCDPVLVKGWQVTVEGDSQRWFYDSNTNGTLVRLHRRELKNQDVKLPISVNDAVVGLAAAHFSLPHVQLLITKVQKQTWTDACLGLPSPVERCQGTPTPGWRVTVAGKPGQTQVYRTDAKGGQIRTEAIAGLPPRVDALPTTTAKLLLQNASARLRVPATQLYILQAEKQHWSNYCLDLPQTTSNCLAANLASWRVTLNGAGRRLVYRVDDAVSQIRVEPTSISRI